MREEFLNKTKNEEKNVNEQIFRNHFNYQSPSFLVKNLNEADQNKNDITENLKKVLNIVYLKS